jgi:nicotinate-nucleotide adenylyltransferase
VSDQRLGLFGGTFDPPHFGHVAAVRAALRSGRFSEIVVTVAGDPYQKSGATSLHNAATRLRMATMAFAGLDGVTVSDREIRRAGPSYTIDTVRELLEGSPTVDIIIGADLVDALDTWHEAEALRELVRVGVVPRPGGSATLAPGWDCYEIPMEPVDLSSTFLRALEAGEFDLTQYVPATVIPIYEGARG